MALRHIFEIPENPDSVVFYPGKMVVIDGKTVVEVRRDSDCARNLLSDWAMSYCDKHTFNPVFIYSKGNLPILVGFVWDESPSSGFKAMSLLSMSRLLSPLERQ